MDVMTAFAFCMVLLLVLLLAAVLQPQTQIYKR